MPLSPGGGGLLVSITDVPTDGVQDFLLMPETPDAAFAAFRDDMFTGLEDLERGARFDPQNFAFDRGAPDVSVAALMAGLLGGEVEIDDPRSGVPVSKQIKEKSVSLEEPDELPPITVVGSVDGWEWLCMSGSIVTLPLTPFIGYDVAALLSNLNDALSGFDIYDVDGDGTPNDSDIAPFDPSDNGILVDGSTDKQRLTREFSIRAWGDGSFALYGLGDNFLGNFRVTNVAHAPNSSLTTGGSSGVSIQGVVPGASSETSYSITSSEGTVYTFTPL